MVGVQLLTELVERFLLLGEQLFLVRERLLLLEEQLRLLEERLLLNGEQLLDRFDKGVPPKMGLREKLLTKLEERLLDGERFLGALGKRTLGVPLLTELEERPLLWGVLPMGELLLDRFANPLKIRLLFGKLRGVLRGPFERVWYGVLAGLLGRLGPAPGGRRMGLQLN